MAGQPALKITSEVEQVTKHMNQVGKKLIPGATAAAMTGTVREVRKKVLKQLRVNFRLPAGEVNKRARIRRAKPKDWRAWIWWNTLQINPAKVWKARQSKRGVRAGKYNYPGHFLAKGRGRGNVELVFRRKGKERYPIEARKLPVGATGENLFKIMIKRGATPIFRKKFRAGMKKRLAKKGLSIGGI